MKKVFIVLLAVMVLFSSVSLAEDLSSMSDAELLELYQRVKIELKSRDLPAEMIYPENVYSGSNLWDSNMAERLETFFGYWYASDIPNMLTLCSSDWKEGKEQPATDLFVILGNRTPLDYEVLSASRESSDFVRSVSVITLMDRNDERKPVKYLLRITMKKEEDGLWYVDPESLTNMETAAGETRAEQAPGSAEEIPETPGSTVLYYVPEGGQYYHADQNCRRVSEKYLPMNGIFTYAELENDAYKDLVPCEICGAPARQENQIIFTDFRGAVDAAGRSAAVGGDIDYLAVASEKDGKYVRMVTLPDDHARALYMAAMSADDSGEAYEAYQDYAWSLPISYTEEFTVKPRDQAELDALAGKTVGELIDEGYFIYGSGGGVDLPTIVDLSYGLYNYEFEVDASFEEYLELMDGDDLRSLKVISGKHSGFSSLASDLDYLANGTYEPQVVPNITAEEAAAADDVPPAEEYTAKAWPLTAEGYSDLLDNLEARYGQVYMVEGVVHQVLSQDPLTVIINTGEDGKSQPVVVKCPGQLSFSWETGCRYRIYADVSSACYSLPVLTARYCYSR